MVLPEGEFNLVHIHRHVETQYKELPNVTETRRKSGHNPAGRGHGPLGEPPLAPDWFRVRLFLRRPSKRFANASRPSIPGTGLSDHPAGWEVVRGDC